MILKKRLTIQRIFEVLVYRLFLSARWFARRQATARSIRVFGRLRVGVLGLIIISSWLPESKRPIAIKAMQKIDAEEKIWLAVIATSSRRWEKRKSLRNLETLVLALITIQQFNRVLGILASVDEDTFLRSAVLRSALTLANHEVGDLAGTVKAARRSFSANADAARTGSDCLYGAFAAGHLRNFPLALEFFASHFNLIEDPFPQPNEFNEKKIWDEILKTLFRFVGANLAADLAAQRRVAIFFLSSTEALGHAILEPYHFAAINRERYERLIFIGPPKHWYKKASTTCLEIVEQYGDYIETTDPLLINLSWMSFGLHEVGTIGLFVHNYWSLLRESTRRCLDPADSFQHNASHFTLPRRFVSAGMQFAAATGIDLGRPIVTIHARAMSYHGIKKQSFRDVEINEYAPAVRYLISRGYQVIRLGDTSMPRLFMDTKNYWELPFEEGYTHELDPFFISRSSFMIGCQSGPCAYARALGRPLLSLNAVYHYTLLPSIQEMAAFKHYMLRDKNGTLRELNVDEILDRNLFCLDNAHQIEDAGLELQTLSSEEMLAAVEAMVAWVLDPALALTEFQSHFQQCVVTTAERIQEMPPFAVADYVGFALPSYRIAPKQLPTHVEQQEYSTQSVIK